MNGGTTWHFVCSAYFLVPSPNFRFMSLWLAELFIGYVLPFSSPCVGDLKACFCNALFTFLKPINILNQKMIGGTEVIIGSSAGTQSCKITHIRLV